jgi:GTP cyclohydrolase II
MPHQSLFLTTKERVNRVRSDLAMGMPCILTHAGKRALLVPLETVDVARFEALRQAFGAPELLITANRAHAVMTAAAAANLGQGPVRIRPPRDADLAWFRRVCDPVLDETEGAVGPLHVQRVGTSILHEAALLLVKSAQLIPSCVLFSIEDPDVQGLAGLSMMELSAEDTRAEIASAPALTPAAVAQLPLEAHDVSRLHVFRDPDGVHEHYVIQIGTLQKAEPVLARIHSACFTGDVLGSLKCDCGPQLRAALARMGEEGAGILLYLNQEGRGIGLAYKMRVYGLQSQGFDTVEANHRLGYDDDERDFRIAADLLRHMKIEHVRLLTNNPAKVATLTEHGIGVSERVPLRVGHTPQNRHYLQVKALKSGHLL